ncbi:MAG TPA: polysaccharide deacetylase [Solirubrobacteraceae bacterium]|nr:polysaccharide deacetylase [Solirubrobacteraceae bacterium]
MSWLGDSAAVAVLSFDVDAESPILAQGRRYADHAMVMTHQAYGPQVGVPRLLALLDDFGIKATFFVPGLTADRYPQTVERIAAAGHEVGHHSYSHRSPVDLGEAAEREDFERALEALERVGVKPKGHRSALWEASWGTPALVAEYGLAYDSTLMDDDRPYLLETAQGTIAELPPHWSLDDWEQYAYLPRPPIGTNIESPAKVLDLWTNELDAMRRHGCLFMLTNHPFLSGRPGRVETLRKLIEHALGRGDVEFATAADVAARVREDPRATRRTLRPVEVDAAIYPEL